MLMPSNKTLTIFILCFGVVISVWFITKKQQTLSQNNVVKKTGGIEAEPAIAIKNTDYDWKKILNESAPKNQKVIDLTKNTTIEEDTTLTDQMSRDFLSQYLIAAKNGTEVTPEVASQIAQNTLSLPDYRPISVVYIKENLKIVKKSDPVTVGKYRDKINQVLIPLYYSLKDNPVTILVNSLQSEKETELKKLDPMILVSKNSVKSLLEMEVPEGAIGFHLNLLNTTSNSLSDLEAMRVAISDPVKVFSVVGNYSQNMINFGNAVINMNDYLQKNSVINLF